MTDVVDLDAPCPKPGEIRPGATVVEGKLPDGRDCRLVDNTATVDRHELAELLETLIRQRRFGMRILSAPGANTLTLGHPEAGHIQFGDTLYRLLLFPFEAHIEAF